MTEPWLEPGREIEPLRTTPDRWLAVRYAGASGDFNPIHYDERFARAAGLDGPILHGLYAMALVARAACHAAGDDPGSLTALEVQFRGMAVAEQQIQVSGHVRSSDAQHAIIDLEAAQGATRIIRNAHAEVRRR